MVGRLLILILTLIAATIIQLAISRSRELGADRTRAYVVRGPEALPSSLEKLEAYSQRIPTAVSYLNEIDS